MALVVGTNSYISLADADAYFVDSLRGAAWDMLTEDMRNKSLVTAARRIDPYVITDYKLPIVVADIPVNLGQANAELALDFAGKPSLITRSNNEFNIKKAKGGSAEVEFFRPVDGVIFDQHVQDLLADCLASSAGNEGLVGAGGFVSGANGESDFEDRTKYNRTEGLY